MLTGSAAAAIAASIDPRARFLRTWALDGGSSALSAVLEVERDGRVDRLVVRTYGDDVENRGGAIAREFAVLERLVSLGVTAPEPVLLDLSGQFIDTPFLVVRYVEGTTHVGSADPVGMARSLADVLADIHRRVPATAVADLALDWHADVVAGHLASSPAVLDESTLEPLVRRALTEHWPPSSGNEPCLLHGDFWPGNVVWNGDRAVAVLDWEAASTGDPLADVGSARLDVLWFLGDVACDAFTHRYREVSGVDTADLPLWDLVAALRPAGEVSHWAAGLPALGRSDIRPSDLRAVLVEFVQRAASALER